MPIGPLFPASNVYIFPDGVEPGYRNTDLLLAMTGPQLYEWQQAFRPYEPVFRMDPQHCRPVEDNEGETEADRLRIASELRANNILFLPPRWIEDAPVPTARQLLQHLYHTRPFGR